MPQIPSEKSFSSIPELDERYIEVAQLATGKTFGELALIE